jgi:putative acetyltransferase
MAVHKDWLSKGIGSALMHSAINLADKWLNLFRLELVVFVDNVSAVKLYEKLGFNIEGRLREFAFRDGEYADAYIMGRIRPRGDRATRV